MFDHRTQFSLCGKACEIQKDSKNPNWWRSAFVLRETERGKESRI